MCVCEFCKTLPELEEVKEEPEEEVRDYREEIFEDLHYDDEDKVVH